jgi:hypothetical protein
MGKSGSRKPAGSLRATQPGVKQESKDADKIRTLIGVPEISTTSPTAGALPTVSASAELGGDVAPQAGRARWGTSANVAVVMTHHVTLSLLSPGAPL